MNFVTVFSGFNPADADLIRSRLEASNFLVNVANENAALTLGAPAAAGGILVQVPEDQVEDARALIASKDSPAA